MARVIIADGYHTKRLIETYMVQHYTVHIERDLKKWVKTEELITSNLYILRNIKNNLPNNMGRKVCKKR